MSNGEIKVAKSKVINFEDMVFDDGRNPLAKTIKINFKEMNAEFEFRGEDFTIRLPDKRLINKFKRITQSKSITNIETNPKKALEVESLQEKVIEDMIIDFKLSKYRMDDDEYLQLTNLCWDFYVFLQQRLIERGKEYSLSLKVT